MKYMGSKLRLAKHLLPIILKGRKANQYYVEPFVGGCNIIQSVRGLRMAGDINPYLIALWKGLQTIDKDTLISPISKELYTKARNQFYGTENNGFSDFEMGWIGYTSSFNGGFFKQGYAITMGGRNYQHEQTNNILRQVKHLKDVEFHNCPYYELQIPPNSIIYCDPPYINTTQYENGEEFNHDFFWAWCRSLTHQHKIFISELTAPKDFTCIWEGAIHHNMRHDKKKDVVEKLFVHESATNINMPLKNKQNNPTIPLQLFD